MSTENFRLLLIINIDKKTVHNVYMYSIVPVLKKLHNRGVYQAQAAAVLSLPSCILLRLQSHPKTKYITITTDFGCSFYG